LNVLKPHLRITIETLLQNGVSQHEIQRRTGADRKTIRKYERLLKIPQVATGLEVKTGQNPLPRPPDGGALLAKKIPAHAASACEPHREWIEKQVALGRNAQSIFQDLVETHGFAQKYNSVKRFVRALKAREPDRFDVLEFLPGEEAQVDYGQGALTMHKHDKYKRPYLFVMTLKYSGKSFRKVVWKTSQEIWAKLHEEAFRSFGGCPEYVVLDNLREGVIKPDIYEPELNVVYRAMLGHYGVVADPCRVGDPNRKGTVESAIQHTQSTALKGRKFESIEEQNEWLTHWEEKWAAPRIHGRKKRQVMEMFLEEKPLLRPLPAEGFRYFEESSRTVDDAGLVQVKGIYYPALPAKLRSEVRVRVYDNEIEILDLDGLVLRRHEKGKRRGEFKIKEEDRIFNPSRETTRLIERVEKIGPSTANLAREIFAKLGRPGQRAIYGIASLTRHHGRTEIELAAEHVLASGAPSFAALKRILARTAGAKKVSASDLKQKAAEIRSIDEYQMFWEMNSQTNNEEEEDGNVYH
jgi:transposase